MRLILGQAGTGKTHRCLEAVREQLRATPVGPPLLLIVPEQATFQVEQALVHTPDLGGIERAHVLSFRRLAYRVFLELGGAARPAIGDLGKRMVLRALLQQRAPELHLFGKQAANSGFVERLATTMTELRTYQRSAADLKSRQEALEKTGEVDTPLWGKLHDLALVMADYEAYLTGRFTDPDDFLSLLAERVHDSRLVREAGVWIDGFAGFTPQELAVLSGVLRAARRVQVTLCLDPADPVATAIMGAGGAGGHDGGTGPGQAGGRGRSAPAPDPTHLFHPTLDTLSRLLKLAAASGTPVEPPVRLDLPYRFRHTPALAHLEREFFRHPGRPYPTPTPTPTPTPAPATTATVSANRPDVLASGTAPLPITLSAFPNRRAEVAAAGQEILRLSRDEGYRFRDIAVIVRDFDTYGELIVANFRNLGIPCFLDQRRAVAHHPAVELVRSALEVAISDWAYEPLFRYLKTDLVPQHRHDVDKLENYALEHGIRGRRWYDGEPWHYIRTLTLEEDPGDPREREQRMLAELNRIREEVVGPLRRFHRKVRRPAAVREISAAMYQLLADLRVPEQLREWAEDAAAVGDLDAAQEHDQVWRGIVELLDQTVESLGNEQRSAREYLEVLEAGLEALRLGVIPPGLDQVSVGAIERSRHPNLRAVLLLGVNDRAFPPAPSEDVVFNDRERDALTAGGFELGPTSRTRTFHEQFLTYQALTRAAERLWISYPSAGEAGKALPPSPIISRIRQLFPDLPLLAGRGGDGLDEVCTPGQLAAALVRRLRSARSGAPLPPEWLPAYAMAQADPALRAAARPVLAALEYRNAVEPLPPDVVRGLYGDVLRSSVSRLETFAACPFQHFARYGLRLEERVQYRLEAPHLGQFLHAGLSLFVDELTRRGLDWGALADDQIAAVAGDIAQRLAPRLHSEILLSSGRYRHSLRVLQRTLNAALSTLAEHARRGRFRPVAVELAFGDGGRLPPWRIELGGHRRLELRGRIDRVDAAITDDGRFCVRVVDYKSSPRSLAIQDVYYGLALQLSLYLLVAARGARQLLTPQQAVLEAAPTTEPALAAAGPAVPPAAPTAAPPAAAHPAEPAGMLYFPVHNPLLRTAGPLSPEQVAVQRRKKQLRMSGLLPDDPAVLRAMDRDLAGDLIPAQANKDGSLSRHSRVAAPEQWHQLFAHVQREVAGLATGILAGQVDVAPYRIGTDRACTHCSYRPVCRFDALVEGNHYRALAKLSDADAWQKLQEKITERPHPRLAFPGESDPYPE